MKTCDRWRMAVLVCEACVCLAWVPVAARADRLLCFAPSEPSLRTLAARGGASWRPQAGRFGGYALCVAASSGGGPERFRLFENPQPLPVPDSYRAEAWVRSESGPCRLELVLYDAAGAEQCRRTILDLVGAAEWRYGACDVAYDGRSAIAAYNVEVFPGGGGVTISDVGVFSSDSVLPNGRFRETDPAPVGQPEEQAAGAPPSRWRPVIAPCDEAPPARATYYVDRTAGHEALVVMKTEGAFILGAEPVRVLPGTLGFVGRLCVAASSALGTTMTVRQYGPRGLLASTVAQELSPLRLVGGGVMISTPFIPACVGASRVEFWLILPREAGTVRIESAGLAALAEPADRLSVCINQAGYEAGGPVRFMVSSGVYPERGRGRFTLRRGDAVVHEDTLVPLGRCAGQYDADWGAYYFEGRLPSLAAGTYELSVTLGNRSVDAAAPLRVVPHALLNSTGELAYRYYAVQRCGCEVPGWHDPCHLDDGKLPDGTHVSVAGGFHNAGDYGKWTGENTSTSVYAMVRAYNAAPAFFDALDRDRNGRADLLDEAVWGCQWLLKMVNPKTGRMWQAVDSGPDYFGPPERETDGVPGNEDDRRVWEGDEPDAAACVMAALAALSRHGVDRFYLPAAERLWSAYEKEIVNGANPRHLFAARELHLATDRENYAAAGERIATQILGLQSDAGWFPGQPGGRNVARMLDEGMIPAALAFYAGEYPRSPLVDRIRAGLRRYYAWSFRMADNPFGVIRNDDADEPYFFMRREGLYVGNNSQYLSSAWAALLASRLFREEPLLFNRLRAHASNHVNWVLGCNPLGLCMIEGVGNSSLIHYHHRYADIRGHERGDVPGTIPNGLIREPNNSDRPWFDLRPIAFPATYPSNESWLPHNAYYLLVLSEVSPLGRLNP